MFAVDAKGVAYEPQTDEPVDSVMRVRCLLEQAERVIDARVAGLADKKRRILIHVHGGLNSGSDSLATAADAAARMERETEAGDWHYPIFVTWPSGAFASYADHACNLRQGRHAKIFGPITAPLFFATDVASGLAMLPRTLGYQIGVDAAVAAKVGFDADWLPSWRNAAKVARVMTPDPQPFAGIAIGDYARGFTAQAGRFVLYWATLIPSIATLGLVVSGMGEGAWGGMLHRTSNLFYAYDEFDQRTIGDSDLAVRNGAIREPSGAFAEFLRVLSQHVSQFPGRDYEITLVGHSMGAIILNQALCFLANANGCCGGATRPLPVRRVVYMAPACSIASAVNGVVPYLRVNRDATFHLLTLHPIAEADEINYWGTVPRGSLLEWIDSFYAPATAPTERRLGKWLNVLQALHLFRDIADRMTVKAFGVAPGSKPQKHGHFNECPFWKASFRDPRGPMIW